jgi:hypothetical protein
VADDDGGGHDDTRDWVADCDGEGQERVVRDGGDRRVVMMAAAAEDGGGGRRWQRRTTAAADNSSMQDWAANYEGEGRERAERDGGDTGWR